MPRSSLLDLLNVLYNDLPANPKQFLKEQIVPFADRFTCPIVVPPFPPYSKPLAILFFVRRVDESKEFHIIAVRFPTLELESGDFFDGDSN
jgi:hypothetical protein